MFASPELKPGDTFNDAVELVHTYIALIFYLRSFNNPEIVVPDPELILRVGYTLLLQAAKNANVDINK